MAINLGFVSVPFKIEGPHGLTKIDGIAKFSSAGIVLEFEEKILGLMKTGVKESQIAHSEILDINMTSGFFDTKFERMFGSKIRIRLNNFLKLSEIPLKDGLIELKIRRHDRALAEAGLARLLEASREVKSQLPEKHNPVSILFDESEDETAKLK